MSLKHHRIAREVKTIEVMVKMYCHNFHNSNRELCHDCRELLDYARVRLEKCPYQENKPTCASCPIHCYKPVMKEKMITVMRYSGPRMILSHPILALLHLVDSYRRNYSDAAEQ